jgi:DNA-binding NarL/FixJ family response regulator
MPVMNGLEAAHRINAFAPRTAMVMVTMHPSGELLKAALQAGVKDVVSKTDRLSARLSTVLRDICV